MLDEALLGGGDTWTVPGGEAAPEPSSASSWGLLPVIWEWLSPQRLYHFAEPQSAVPPAGGYPGVGRTA